MLEGADGQDRRLKSLYSPTQLRPLIVSPDTGPRLSLSRCPVGLRPVVRDSCAVSFAPCLGPTVRLAKGPEPNMAATMGLTRPGDDLGRLARSHNAQFGGIAQL